MWCIVIEHALAHVEVVGTFATEEEANDWARQHRKTHIWRTAEYRDKASLDG